MPEQSQLPLPTTPISEETKARQRGLVSPKGKNPILWGVPELGLDFNEYTSRCLMRGVSINPGCVLVKSRSLGNFFATGLGWEHFPIVDGQAAHPHLATFAHAVFME